MDLLVQHLTFQGKCKDPMEQQDGGWEGGGSTMNFIHWYHLIYHLTHKRIFPDINNTGRQRVQGVVLLLIMPRQKVLY